MSILSRAKSVAKKAVSAVKSAAKTVKSVFSDAAGKAKQSFAGSQTAAVADAIGYKPKAKSGGMEFNVGDSLNTYAADQQAKVTPTGKAGGTTYYNNYTPSGGSPNYVPLSVGSTPYGPPKTISSGKQSTQSGTNEFGGVGSFGYGPQTISSKSFAGAESFAQSGGAASSFAQMSSTPGTGVSPVVMPSNPGSINPNVDTTALAGRTAGLYERQNDGTFKEVAQEEQTTEDRVQQEMDLYNKFLGEEPNIEDDREIRQAREQKRLIQEALRAPTNELNAVIAKQNSDILAHRKMISESGGTETGFGGVEAAINYNAAIRALPLQASIASLQGDLELATDYLTELRQVKSEQIKRQYEYRKGVFEAIRGVISTEDERAYKEKVTENERSYKNEQKLVDLQAELSMMVMQNAPDSVRTNIVNRVNSAGTIKDAIMAAGKYGTDMLGRSIQQQQYNNAVLQGDKLKSEIESNQPVTGEYAPIINGASALVAGTKKQVVKNNIASALSNGQFDVAYSEIANAVADGITGTNKTKFDDARTDIGVMSGMKTAIQNYANAGGDMNLLVGTSEKIKKNLGIDSGKASVLATQLWREFQTYRSNMTGAAFSEQESRDYASVNPTLGKSLNLNLAVIDGAIAQLSNRVTSTVNARIPGAQKIFDMAYGTNNSGNDENTTPELQKLRSKYNY